MTLAPTSDNPIRSFLQDVMVFVTGPWSVALIVLAISFIGMATTFIITIENKPLRWTLRIIPLVILVSYLMFFMVLYIAWS